MALSAGVGRASSRGSASTQAAELWKGATANLSAPPRALILFSPFSGKEHLGVVAELSRLSGGCPLIGGTTYGAILGSSLEEEAHVLLALSGDIRAGLGLGTGLAHDAFAAGRSAAQRAAAALEGPGKLLILFHEPQMGDCARLVDGVRSVLGENFPVVGGGTGTGLIMEQSPVSKQFLGTRVLAGGCAAMLLGGEFRLSFGFSHGAVAVGKPFTLTKAKGNILVELDGRPALEVLEETLGVACSSGLPFSAFSVSCGKLEEGFEEFPLMGFWGADRARKTVLCGTPIQEGRRYVFVRTRSDSILEDTRRAAREAARALKPSTARLALVFDCYGRKIQLGSQGLIQAELKALAEAAGSAPLVGMYSGSEIGVLKGPGGRGVSRYTHASTAFVVLGD